MKITKQAIADLLPCGDRFNNFVANYPDYNGDLSEFITLPNITYSDKVWVVTRLFTKEQNIRWSIVCAESTLHHFETEYPNDTRPRQALEAAANVLISDSAARSAAYAAADAAARSVADAVAYAAADTVARSAAYAAADAAADAVAYAARSAAYAAAYAVACSARSAADAVADAAAYAARSAADAVAYAARSAAYAAADAAADAVAYAARSAAYAAAYAVAEKEQEEKNLQFMWEVLCATT